jgi:hypothetical protein
MASSGNCSPDMLAGQAQEFVVVEKTEEGVGGKIHHLLVRC